MPASTHGSGWICFRPSETRSLSASNFSTFTLISSPTLEELARVVHAAPRHVGHVEQAVDAAEIDERAVVGEVLDHAVDDLARRQRLERLARSFSRSVSSSARRDSTMLARRLLNLMILNSSRWFSPIIALEVAHRPQVDLRTRQERLDADVDREAALDARDRIGALDGAPRPRRRG